MNLEHIKQHAKRYQVPQERSPQFQKQIRSYYKNVDGINIEIALDASANDNKHLEMIAQSLLATIFDNNPKLAPYRQYFSATLIVSDKEYTQNSRIGKYSLITLDMLTCGLAHDLNRIFIETTKSEIITPKTKKHVRETLDYFASKLLISRGRDSRLVEIPILPPYSETITAQMAGAIINSQELFLLAHELGHYFIDQNLLHLFGENTLDKTQIIFQLILVSEKRFKLLTDEQKKSLFDEILADEIAYQIYHETTKEAEKAAYDGLFYYLNILLSSQYYVKYLLSPTKHNSYEILSWQIRLKYYYFKFKELEIWGARLNDYILEYVKVIANESFRLRNLYCNPKKRKKQRNEKNKRKAAKRSRKANRNI